MGEGAKAGFTGKGDPEARRHLKEGPLPQTDFRYQWQVEKVVAIYLASQPTK